MFNILSFYRFDVEGVCKAMGGGAKQAPPLLSQKDLRELSLRHKLKFSYPFAI